MTQESFNDCIEAGKRLQTAAYASGEPAQMMEAFYGARRA
jgi:hypothetical protein